MERDVIRRAVEADAGPLAALVTQLGYPAAEGEIGERLRRILASPDHLLLVAEGRDGRLMGWIDGHLSQVLESRYRVEIGGLLVDGGARRKGLGRRLVAALEGWAVGKGAREMSVRCRVERAEAHQFYEALDFRHVKTQRVFRKSLGGGGERADGGRRCGRGGKRAWQPGIVVMIWAHSRPRMIP